MHIHSPGFRSGGGGGWSQAGFHTVNYSVANSAPGRGGRRESESEALLQQSSKSRQDQAQLGPQSCRPMDLQSWDLNHSIPSDSQELQGLNPHPLPVTAVPEK